MARTTGQCNGKPNKVERIKLLRTTKLKALEGDTAALLAYSNLELADAIRQRPQLEIDRAA